MKNSKILSEFQISRHLFYVWNFQLIGSLYLDIRYTRGRYEYNLDGEDT